MIPEDPRSVHICPRDRMYHVRFRDDDESPQTASSTASSFLPTARLSFKRNTSAPIPNPTHRAKARKYSRFARRCENKKRSTEGKQNRTKRRSIKEENTKKRDRQRGGGGVKTRREKDRERKMVGKSESEITSKWEKKWKQKAKGNGEEEERSTAEGR